MAISGLVSILNETHYVQVEALWETLEKECGLSATREVSTPHFSWQIAEDYDLEALRKKIRSLTQEFRPFDVSTEGLGVFTGEKPVVYVQVTKTPQLASMHQNLWESIEGDARGLSQLYSPDNWMPHITLANNDVDLESLACAMSTLGGREFDWRIKVDNFAIVVQEESEEGKVVYSYTKYPFQT